MNGEILSSQWAGSFKWRFRKNSSATLVFRSESVSGTRADTLGLMRLHPSNLKDKKRFQGISGTFVDAMPSRHRGRVHMYRDEHTQREMLDNCEVQSPFEEESEQYSTTALPVDES